jgi:hypothetical protein
MKLKYMFLNLMGSIIIHPLVLHGYDHCRADINIGVQGKGRQLSFIIDPSVDTYA